MHGCLVTGGNARRRDCHARGGRLVRRGPAQARAAGAEARLELDRAQRRRTARLRQAQSPCSTWATRSCSRSGPAAASYEVRDYWGELVDQGPAARAITLKVKQPGWYKLYVYGKEATKEWGDVVGGTMLVIFRRNPNFPELPPKGTPGGGGTEDEVMRGVSRHGPAAAFGQRRQARGIDPRAGKVDRHRPRDVSALRPAAASGRLMIAFPNGTQGEGGGRAEDRRALQGRGPLLRAAQRAQLRQQRARISLEKEMKPFYATVKGVDRSLKVMGPGTVAIGPSLLPWIEDFLKAGGGDYIDAFSFHVYNGINGDLVMGRKSMDNLLALLKKYGADKKELWQTEQGYFAAMYGVYQPRHQGRWTMLEMMLFDQYGLPREHNHLWYDRSHGFWDFPTWWENDDGGFNPAVPLMRVFAEEQFGTRFLPGFRLRRAGQQAVHRQPVRVARSVQGRGHVRQRRQSRRQVPLKVAGGDKLHVVSAFGVEQDLPVRGGAVVLPRARAAGLRRAGRGQNDRGRADRLGAEPGPRRGRGRGGRLSAGAAEELAGRRGEDPPSGTRLRRSSTASWRTGTMLSSPGDGPVDGQRRGVAHLGRGPRCPRRPAWPA